MESHERAFADFVSLPLFKNNSENGLHLSKEQALCIRFAPSFVMSKASESFRRHLQEKGAVSTSDADNLHTPMEDISMTQRAYPDSTRKASPRPSTRQAKNFNFSIFQK